LSISQLNRWKDHLLISTAPILILTGDISGSDPDLPQILKATTAKKNLFSPKDGKKEVSEWSLHSAPHYRFLMNLYNIISFVNSPKPISWYPILISRSFKRGDLLAL